MCIRDRYNPRIDEEMAALPGFAGVHPLAPEHAVAGCREVLDTASRYLCQITGMDGMTFQPAAGAHGEFTGVLLIKQYHDARGDHQRTKIIVPDSAHGTNPATAAMCGYQVVNIPSAADGCVDLEALKAVLGDDVAGLMLTNPNTCLLYTSGQTKQTEQNKRNKRRNQCNKEEGCLLYTSRCV